MREAYRLYKNDFYAALNAKNQKFSLALIYTSRKPELYGPIELSVKKLMVKISL